MAPLRLTVELDAVAHAAPPGEELAVAGTVRRENGSEHPFVGWVNLMALLHDAFVGSRVKS